MEWLEINDCGPVMVMGALRLGVKKCRSQEMLHLKPPRSVDHLMEIYSRATYSHRRGDENNDLAPKGVLTGSPAEDARSEI